MSGESAQSACRGIKQLRTGIKQKSTLQRAYVGSSTRKVYSSCSPQSRGREGSAWLLLLAPPPGCALVT